MISASTETCHYRQRSTKELKLAASKRARVTSLSIEKTFLHTPSAQDWRGFFSILDEFPNLKHIKIPLYTDKALELQSPGTQKALANHLALMQKRIEASSGASSVELFYDVPAGLIGNQPRLDTYDYGYTADGEDHNFNE